MRCWSPARWSALALLALWSLACDKRVDAPVTDPPPAADPCATARSALEEHLQTLPRQCAADSDCRAQYVRADPCAAPVVTVAAWEPSLDAKLPALQARVRSACALGKECAPVFVNPGCRQGVCVDDRGTSGTAQRGCAPGGGPAWTFTVTNGQEATCEQAAFPYVSATIWHEVDPGDFFRIDSSKRSSGVMMRCQQGGACVTGSGTVRVSGVYDGGRIVELEGSFEGSAVKQTFFARPCPGEERCP